MKHFIITFTGLLISMSLFPQQLSYKGSLVDTLRISCNSGYYHFDTCGTSTGTEDRYILVFHKEKNSYMLHDYKRIRYKRTYKPDTYSEKKTLLKEGTLIGSALVADLLGQFEIGYRKPAFEHTGMSNTQFLRLTGRKQLSKVAKQYQGDRNYLASYFIKEEKDVFRGCQHPDTFNLYLATAFDTTGFAMITDVWEEFEVCILTAKGKYLFQAAIPNPFMQPWEGHTYKGDKLPKLILNLAINRSLVALLPKGFTAISSLKPEALIHDYIVWYLKRRGLIDSYR